MLTVDRVIPDLAQEMKNSSGISIPHHYIKVVYQTTVYGPFQGPISLARLAKLMRISMRAKPLLQSMDTEKITVITNENAIINAGLYSLAADPSIVYDEAIDGAMETSSVGRNKFGQFRDCQTQTDSSAHHNGEYSAATSGICNLPLDRSEMEHTVEGMIHLLSSIPPRYIKYNKVLAAQMKISLDQVNEWIKSLSIVYQDMENDKIGLLHASGVTFATYVTFVQYRILSVMHDIWKKVWTRFPPSSRVFNVSTIYTYNSLENAEHILNCLSSWRRMMDAEAWDKIHRHNAAIVESDVKKRTLTAKDRLLQPSRLASTEHAGDRISLAQSFGGLKDISNNQELQNFRIAFIQELRRSAVFKNDELKTIKNKMLKERKLNRDSIDFISNAIEKEFRIY